MKTMITKILAGIVLITWISGCAILQRESPEKKARAFMLSFQESLLQDDNAVLKFFESDQSTESLLAAINLLQNEDNELVDCLADFNNMKLDVETNDQSFEKIFVDHSIVKVTVPVHMQAKQDGNSNDVDLVFRLKEQNNKFIIYKLEAESLYTTFTSLKHKMQYSQHQWEEIKNREAIYTIAESLRTKYDNVVWYSKYNGEIFFYVVNGDWSEELVISSEAPATNFKMGLVNSKGEEIVPVEFKMIGIIGAEIENAFEVRGADGYGYYSLDGRELVKPAYLQIIPYPNKNIWIVQTENTFGWVDSQKKFFNGFLNEQIEKGIKEFSHLPSGITINEGTYSLCETPTPEGAGSGLFISPSYWVHSGMIDPFKSGFTTTASDAPIGGWTEYVEIGETFFQTLGDKLGVVIANFKERYIEGREEFYESNKVLFTDSDQQSIASVSLGGDGLSVKKISDELIELSATRSFNAMDMGIAEDVSNPRYYRYYKIDGNNLFPLESKRSRPETEFVKLDSSYVTGAYTRIDYSTNSLEEYNITPEFENMRNEILAEYGYIFPDESVLAKYNQYKWYNPRFETEEEFEEMLTEIDRHNLKFLAGLIALQKESI